jgi:Domain of unknown function (DUF4129)
MPGKGARGGADMRRAAAVLLLVAVAAVGLRAGGAFSAAGSPAILGLSGRAVYWTIAGAEVVLGLAGIALLIARLIWGRGSGRPLQRKRRSLWWLLLLPFFTFGLAGLLRKLHQRSAAAAAAAIQPGPRNGHAAHVHAGNPWPLLVSFAVVSLAAAALIAYRRRAVPPPPPPDAGLETEPLAAALAAGARALQEDADPRTAIIGCYAAMERSLADAGLPPRMADTPAEVLNRATASGLVRSTPAATLTGLFRQARYSSHPMTEADRAAAIGALAQVRADLDSGTPARAGLGGAA